MRWLKIVPPLGKIIAFFGILMLLPALVSFLYDDGLAFYYLSAGGGVFFFGAFVSLLARPFRGELRLRHGFLLITLTWTLLPCFAALPLVWLLPGLSFTKAYFEAASGLTASGATVLQGLDSLPPSINFWRGEMSWIGGMGLIVLATAILPILGVGGSGVFQTELPGPNKENRMTPKIAQTAKLLWLIYAALTAICATAYYLAGMSGLDSIIHAFTTIGLGGFSTHDASYGFFNSPLIEGIAVFFMLIAGMNFATHYTAWAAKSWRIYFASQEWRTFLILVVVAVAGITWYLKEQQVYGDWMTAFRYASFNTVSIVTTTGYANTNFALWPLFAPMVILLMANFTACSGSTGGGIKLIRLLIVFHHAKAERMKLTHPSAYYDTKVGQPLPQKVLVSVLYFLLLYVAFIVLLTMFLIATGADLLTAFSAAVASVSNTGPGLGEVGPASGYGHLADRQIWACSFAMLMGRLELMSFLVVLHPGFWKN